MLQSFHGDREFDLGPGVWATLLALAFLSRTALDWLVPTANFHARAGISTALGGGLFVFAGFCAALKLTASGTGQ